MVKKYLVPIMVLCLVLTISFVSAGLSTDYIELKVTTGTSTTNESSDSNATFSLDKSNIYAKLKPGETESISFTITNDGTESLDMEVTSSLGVFGSILESFTLEEGGSQTITTELYVPLDKEPDVYVGTISVEDDTGAVRKISVSIEVVSEQGLFGVDVEIPNGDLIVYPGKTIEAKISLNKITESDLDNMKITYIVKDSNGVAVVTEEDVINLKDSKEINKKIKIPSSASYGKHILYIKADYESKIASASKWFDVESKQSNMITLVVIVILVIALIVGIVFGVKHIQKGKSYEAMRSGK